MYNKTIVVDTYIEIFTTFQPKKMTMHFPIPQTPQRNKRSPDFNRDQRVTIQTLPKAG